MFGLGSVCQPLTAFSVHLMNNSVPLLCHALVGQGVGKQTVAAIQAATSRHLHLHLHLQLHLRLPLRLKCICRCCRCCCSRCCYHSPAQMTLAFLSQMFFHTLSKSNYNLSTQLEQFQKKLQISIQFVLIFIYTHSYFILIIATNLYV